MEDLNRKMIIKDYIIFFDVKCAINTLLTWTVALGSHAILINITSLMVNPAPQTAHDVTIKRTFNIICTQLILQY